VARDSELWDGRVVNLQVVETTPESIKLRALVSARNSPRAWDLRCEVREKVTTWLQAEHPGALPKTRAEVLKQPADRVAAEEPTDALGETSEPASEGRFTLSPERPTSASGRGPSASPH
jgi:hypothetical protein